SPAWLETISSRVHVAAMPERTDGPATEPPPIGVIRATTLAGVRLAVEIALARAAGRLSRLAGRGGGTTLPGKLLATVDPDAVGRLAGRLPLGSALVSATNGKTTTASLVA